MIKTMRQTVSLGTQMICTIGVTMCLAACGQRYSHDDFAALVKDKSTTEVAAKLGNPDAVDESGGTIKWTYKSKTFATDGGTQFDAKTVVVFRQADPNVPAKTVDVLYEK